MQQLMHRGQCISVVLPEASLVKCHFNYDKKILDIQPNLADKRNVYLLFKEMINKIIKEAK